MKAELGRLIAVLAFGALFVASVPSLVAADTGAGSAHHERGARFQQWLGLTDQQMSAIRQIRQQDAPAMKQHHQALRQARMDLRQAVLNGADQGTIQVKMANVQTLVAQGEELRVKNLQQIAPILTPEQRAKLASFEPGHRWHKRGGQGTGQPG